MGNTASLVVVWRITEDCNLGCPFCGYSRDLERPRHRADPDQVRSFGSLLGAYGSEQGRNVLVSWIGGEPFAWPPLLDVSHELKRRHGLQIGATTNAVLLDSPSILARVVEDFDQLTISVDSMRRGGDGERCLFDTVRSVLRSLRELIERMGKGPVLRANFCRRTTSMTNGTQISAVVTKGTEALLEQFVRATGVKKGYVIEVALRHHLMALHELPSDVIIPPRLVVSRMYGKEIARRVRSSGRATRDLRRLMAGHADKATRRGR